MRSIAALLACLSFTVQSHRTRLVQERAQTNSKERHKSSQKASDTESTHASSGDSKQHQSNLNVGVLFPGLPEFPFSPRHSMAKNPADPVRFSLGHPVVMEDNLFEKSLETTLEDEGAEDASPKKSNDQSDARSSDEGDKKPKEERWLYPWWNFRPPSPKDIKRRGGNPRWWNRPVELGNSGGIHLEPTPEEEGAENALPTMSNDQSDARSSDKGDKKPNEGSWFYPWWNFRPPSPKDIKRRGGNPRWRSRPVELRGGNPWWRNVRAKQKLSNRSGDVNMQLQGDDDGFAFPEARK